MGVQRIISFALNGENGTGKLVLQIQWANVLRERLVDVALRPQHVINGS
jgi:KaiC/GvpD/RAD55 family RecA-like ATPase